VAGYLYPQQSSDDSQAGQGRCCLALISKPYGRTVTIPVQPMNEFFV
jgi:hypothetical protein